MFFSGIIYQQVSQKENNKHQNWTIYHDKGFMNINQHMMFFHGFISYYYNTIQIMHLQLIYLMYNTNFAHKKQGITLT